MRIHNIKLENNLENNNSNIFRIIPESYKKQKLLTGTWIVKFECDVNNEDEALEILLTDASNRFRYLYCAKIESSMNGYWCRYVAGDEEPVIKEIEYEGETCSLWELDLLELEEIGIVECKSMHKTKFQITNDIGYVWFNYNAVTYEYGSLEINESGIITCTPWLLI